MRILLSFFIVCFSSVALAGGTHTKVLDQDSLLVKYCDLEKFPLGVSKHVNNAVHNIKKLNYLKIAFETLKDQGYKACVDQSLLVASDSVYNKRYYIEIVVSKDEKNVGQLSLIMPTGAVQGSKAYTVKASHSLGDTDAWFGVSSASANALLQDFVEGHKTGIEISAATPPTEVSHLHKIFEENKIITRENYVPNSLSLLSLGNGNYIAAWAESVYAIAVEKYVAVTLQWNGSQYKIDRNRPSFPFKVEMERLTSVNEPEGSTEYRAQKILDYLGQGIRVNK